MTTYARSALRTLAGSGVIATALVAFTGIPAFATPLASCDGVTSTPATEGDLRAAIAGADAVICVDSGTIDFSTSGSLPTGPIAIERDVTIIGIGEVIFEGGGDSSFLATSGTSSFDVTVQNITFQHGYAASTTTGSAIDFASQGFLAVQDSTFANNGGLGAAIAGITPAGDGIVQPAFIVDNSLFVDNGSAATAGHGGAIFAYGDLTVTNSTFLNNSGSANGGAITGNAALTVQGNLFEGNSAHDGGGALEITGGTGAVDISNNTFRGNIAGTNGGAVELRHDATFADNTFVDNMAGASGDALFTNSGDSVSLFANIFASSTDAVTAQVSEEAPDGASPYADLGANISTSSADAATLNNSNAIVGQIGAHYASIGLSALADNGGPTQTMALNAGSIAIGAATPEIRPLAAADIVVPTVDQRGFSRGDDTTASDAGAFQHDPPVEPTELPNTGVSPLGALALGGTAALIGAAALVAARRRRSA